MNRLKELRKSKRLTQLEVSKILKVPQSNVSNFEKGKSKLNEDQIIQLVKVLECSADYLLGLIEEDKQKEQIWSAFFVIYLMLSFL